MQGTMSVTKSLTLLAMVLAIALGGHAVSADTTNSSKAKQLVSLGSMPSSPSSVADEDSKMHSLRTRDTTSAETAEERDGSLTMLKKALIVVEEAPIGTRLGNFLPDSMRMVMSQVKASLLSKNSPMIWFDEGWLPARVELYLGDVSSGRAKLLMDEFIELFNTRDFGIRQHFVRWLKDGHQSIESQLEERYRFGKELANFYDDEYTVWRVNLIQVAKDKPSSIEDAEKIDFILREHFKRWSSNGITTIKGLLRACILDPVQIKYYEQEYQNFRSLAEEAQSVATTRFTREGLPEEVAEKLPLLMNMAA